ncbi:MAG: helix-turn-helix domain-containing protein [Chloroflexota bacterium]|jgi:transposase|nr:helix-turn-helix domain-containing protein [Chloroflexota bacterium]
MLAIAQRRIDLSDTDRDTIRALLHQRELPPRVRERLEMVKAADHGQSLATIAAWSGRSLPTVCHWLSRFADGGIAALTDAPRPGRPVKATAAYLRALEQAVETAPSDLGLPFDVWTSARLRAYLANQTGVTISAGWLRALLARQRFTYGRPKHTLGHLQDPDAVRACEAELAQVGGKGGCGA